MQFRCKNSILNSFGMLRMCINALCKVVCLLETQRSYPEEKRHVVVLVSDGILSHKISTTAQSEMFTSLPENDNDLSKQTEEFDVMMLIQCIIASVGIITNLTVVIVFVNHKELRRKIPNRFIINQISIVFIIYRFLSNKCTLYQYYGVSVEHKCKVQQFIPVNRHVWDIYLNCLRLETDFDSRYWMDFFTCIYSFDFW